MNSVNQEFGFFLKYLMSIGRSGSTLSRKNFLAAYTLIAGRNASIQINAMYVKRLTSTKMQEAQFGGIQSTTK
jgi:hypothetical protein